MIEFSLEFESYEVIKFPLLLVPFLLYCFEAFKRNDIRYNLITSKLKTFLLAFAGNQQRTHDASEQEHTDSLEGKQIAIVAR